MGTSTLGSSAGIVVCSLRGDSVSSTRRGIPMLYSINMSVGTGYGPTYNNIQIGRINTSSLGFQEPFKRTSKPPTR